MKAGRPRWWPAAGLVGPLWFRIGWDQRTLAGSALRAPPHGPSWGSGRGLHSWLPAQEPASPSAQRSRAEVGPSPLHAPPSPHTAERAAPASQNARPCASPAGFSAPRPPHILEKLPRSGGLASPGTPPVAPRRAFGKVASDRPKVWPLPAPTHYPRQGRAGSAVRLDARAHGRSAAGRSGRPGARAPGKGRGPGALTCWR